MSTIREVKPDRLAGDKDELGCAVPFSNDDWMGARTPETSASFGLESLTSSGSREAPDSASVEIAEEPILPLRDSSELSSCCWVCWMSRRASRTPSCCPSAAMRGLGSAKSG